MHSKPGGKLPAFFVDSALFPQSEHANNMNKRGGKAMRDRGTRAAHNLVRMNPYSHPFHFFPSYSKQVGAHHRKGGGPDNFTELHCVQPAANFVKNCIIVHSGGINWAKWKGKIKCYDTG